MNNSELHFNPAPAQMSESAFINTFGGVYEHSPWIAKAAWQAGLNAAHSTPAGLSEAMQGILAKADDTAKLALINAHPDLAGKAAVSGELTKESTAEQSGAGIDQCNAEEFERFQRYNSAYKQTFGFPFIMAVKGSNRHAILAAFEQRLNNTPAQEFQQALIEINKIARFRLDALAEQKMD